MEKPGIVIFDIETQNTYQETGSNDPRGLKVSVVGVYSSINKELFCVEEQELGRLWPIFEHADALVGFNIRHFDLPVLNNYYSGDLLRLPMIDLMEEPTEFLGFRPSLNDLAQATLGTSKSGTGLEALDWWREGKIDKVKEYCMNDVRITRDILYFGQENGFVMFRDRLNREIKIPVRFAIPTSNREMINLSLPL